MFISVASLPGAGVRSRLGLVRAIDRGFRRAASLVLRRLPARPTFILLFSPGYTIIGGLAVLVY